MAKEQSKPACHAVGQVTTRLLLAFFALSSCALQAAASFPAEPQNIFLPPVEPARHPDRRSDLHLRHIFHHGARQYPGLHRKVDIPSGLNLQVLEDDESIFTLPAPRLRVNSQTTNIQRLADRTPERLDALQAAGQRKGSPLDLSPSAWTIDAIRGPNYTDKETVLSFVRMSSNAYVLGPSDPDWVDVGGGFNYTQDFGWEADGIRGHIFADPGNKTVVMALKGTSPAVFDGSGTSTKDKINDNLFFSCCCGQGGSGRWLGVCDCKTATYTCNATCLATNLQERDRYYDAAKELYRNVTALYPESEIWLTGHSLGGALASLLGLTYGSPVLTFGAPGDAMPAARLGLPIPPAVHVGSAGNQASTGGVHFGHTADPIFMGSCNGWSSSCSIAGYAMESVCHTGRECVYDTVKEKGWHNNMLNHRIAITLGVIEGYDDLASCAPVTDCYDCYNWKYFKSNHSSVTTTKALPTSSFTQTRTETCKTPGWWGCQDETTTTTGTGTTTSSTTSKTTSTSTSTCKTPGWFGCRDPITTTATTEKPTTKTTKTTKTTTSADSSEPSETCEFLGIFFCHPCSTTTSSAISATSRSHGPSATPAPTITTTRPRPTKTTVTTTSSFSCRHPDPFFGCGDPWDDPWGAASATGGPRTDRSP